MIYLTTTILILYLTGCSVVAFDTQRSSQTENRKSDELKWKEVKLFLNSSSQGISFRLQYQPYYQLEKRQEITTKYLYCDFETNSLESYILAGELLAGVYALGYLGDSVSVETENNLTDESTIYNASKEDGENEAVSKWKRTVSIGILASISLDLGVGLWKLFKGEKISYTSWESTGESQAVTT